MKLLEKLKLKNLSGNNRIVLINITGAFGVKGLALLISLFTTPAFIRYFGDNAVLGVWYTLLSVLTWFLNFDLGIGNGIRNRLVKDFSAKDREGARTTISSGMFSIAIVTLGLTAVGIALISLLDLNTLYNTSEAVIPARILFSSSICVFVGIMLRFFLTTVTSVFYSMQKSAVNNFLALCVSILQLLFVLIFRFESPAEALMKLSIAYMILSNAPVFLAGVAVFLTKLRDCRPSLRYVRREAIRSVMGVGAVFFACQILYMLIMNTNDFLITNLFGPAYTTEYSFYNKLSGIISTLISLAMTPIWSVVTKAVAEKNYGWIERLYRYLKLVGFAAIAVQFLFVPIEQFVMDVWLGENSITINYITAIAFSCFGGVFVYSSILSTLVCGMARMRLQAVCYGIGVIAKFAVVFALHDVFDTWTLVVWSNVLILLPYCVLQQIDLDRHIKKMKLEEKQAIKEKET